MVALSAKKSAVFVCPPDTICQPLSVFGKDSKKSQGSTLSIEGALELIFAKADRSQKTLLEYVRVLANHNGRGALVVDPGVKSPETALDKLIYRNVKTKGHVRAITDVYRASIVVPTLPAVYEVIKDMQENQCPFHILKINDMFLRPLQGGYRDVQVLLGDPANDGIVGELRIQLCRIKLFSDTVGHHMYEAVREIREKANKEHRRLTYAENQVIDAIVKSSVHGYESVMASPQFSSCIGDLKGASKSTSAKTRTPSRKPSSASP